MKRIIRQFTPDSVQRWRWMSGLLFGLALALRLFRLDAQSLWLDEGGTWDTVTSRSWGGLVTDLWSARAGYPLYHLLMKGWVALAGDSAWMLRFPSALAGAAVVALTYTLGRRLRDAWLGMTAATLLLINPFALWIAQDAKVYSLLMLVVGWSLLALLAALQRGGSRRWLLWFGLLVMLLMTHRLALFMVIGQVALVGWRGPFSGRTRRVLQLAPLALIVGLAFGLAFGLRQDPNAPPVGTSVPPLRGLWLLLGYFTLDRTGAAGQWLALLTCFGVGAGVVALRRHARLAAALPAQLLLLSGLLPLSLYLGALALGAPLFEPRYISFLLPLWAITLAFGLVGVSSILSDANGPAFGRWVGGLVLLAFVAVQGFALLAKPYGLWSGVVVKEDYRGAVTELARRVVPGDVVVVHPAYIAPLYRYYAPRVSPDPLPAPLAFGRAGAAGYDQKEFDNDYSVLLAGKRRGWLLIAPLNARTIDPPDPRYPQDDMGRVGINFLTADLNEKWRCLDEPYRAFNGLRVLCQSFPAPLQPGTLEQSGTWPIPQSATATFGNALDLLGYEFASWYTDGSARAGGSLPLRMTWQARTQLPTDYRMFVHLVPTLGAPVGAQVDAAPLNGGLPTSRWPVNRSIHDEIAVPLPAEMQPGRYLVVLGWYDPAIPDVETQRLPVTAHSGPAQRTTIELGTVEITR